MRAPGLLQKYSGRALLISTGACAVHCRYCFRREFPYADSDRGVVAGTARSRPSQQDRSIEEVILSGGDPLSLTDARLRQLTDALRPCRTFDGCDCTRARRSCCPMRIDGGFLGWLRSLPWPTVVVLHAQSRQRDRRQRARSRAPLRAAGATLLNQSVMLAGVNDTAAALEALSQALWSAQVLPYYIHLLDRVRGTAHFEVPEPQAQRLMAQVAARLPGYLVPRLVREEPAHLPRLLVPPPGASEPWDAPHSSAQVGC